MATTNINQALADLANNLSTRAIDIEIKINAADISDKLDHYVKFKIEN